MTYTSIVPGRKDGGTPATGFVGEVLEVIQTTYTNFATTGQWGDLGNISITPGRWLVSLTVDATLNGATCAGWAIGIGTATGNNNAGLTYGTTQVAQQPPTSGSDSSACVCNYVIDTSSTISYYAKVRATYSSGNPQYTGRMTAVRLV
jgi:hypothetical protein